MLYPPPPVRPGAPFDPHVRAALRPQRGAGRKPLGFEIVITPADGTVERKVQVTKVSPHGLAKLLKPGDCIRTINGRELASLPNLSMVWIRGLVDRNMVDLSITRQLSSGIDPQEGCTIC